MAWANQRVYESIQTLPLESLESFIVNEDWTAKRILKHLAQGSDWFLYCLQGGTLQNIRVPVNMLEVSAIAKTLKATDQKIIKIGELDDEMLTITFKGQSQSNLRSTVISQSVHHATEHRAQLIGALEFKGYKPLILDDIGLWDFETIEPEIEKNS